LLFQIQLVPLHYGDKKKSFTDRVPSGMLPVVEIDGVIMTESAAIAAALEVGPLYSCSVALESAWFGDSTLEPYM
jgi:hypothetical protein